MEIDINKGLFYKISFDSTLNPHERFNIGTYKEKKLHIIMKHYFEQDTAFHEVPYEGFIADIKKGNCITEIETSGFSGLGEKLAAYLPACRVNLVYPIPHIRYISWIDPDTGEFSPKRRSPKKPGVYDAIYELIRIRPYINHPNLIVTAVLLNVDDYRMLNGWSRDRKKGSVRYERIPTDICRIVSFETDADYMAVFPESCRDGFTNKGFAENARISRDTAQAVVKVYEERGLVERNGKRGREIAFSLTAKGAQFFE